MKYYHATDYSNLESILAKGLLNNNIEHIVYLTKSLDDAIKFPFMHGVRDIVVFEVDIDEDKVFEKLI